MHSSSSLATTVSTDAPFTGPENFIPFGPGNSVQLPTGSNVFSAEILLETDFVFFGRKQTSLYVSLLAVLHRYRLVINITVMYSQQ